MNASYEQIDWQPMPQAHNQPETRQLLVALLRDAIPAFVIRSAVEFEGLEAEYAHDRAVESMKKIIKELHPRKKARKGLDERSRGFDIGGIGVFHTDIADTNASLRSDKSVPHNVIRTGLAVHTDVFGVGLVVAAKPGPDYSKLGKRDDEVSRYGAESTSKTEPCHPNMLLNMGLVNTALTDPTCYITLTQPGDSVIMAEGGRHSSWHLFDSPVPGEQREFRLTTLHNRRFLGDTAMQGFDL
jgi:hypothetical protein